MLLFKVILIPITEMFILRCSVGGDTEILRFNPPANNTWAVFAQMTKKAGSKLEVSTIECRTVHNYWDENAIQYVD